jgi:hypothetical protein
MQHFGKVFTPSESEVFNLYHYGLWHETALATRAALTGTGPGLSFGRVRWGQSFSLELQAAFSWRQVYLLLSLI